MPPASQTQLDTLNLNQNSVAKLENLEHMTALKVGPARRRRRDAR